MIQKFQTNPKPIVVDAVEWTPTNLDEIKAFCPKVNYAEWPPGEPYLLVPTKLGNLQIRFGWWIVKNVCGEFEGWSPEFFAKRYVPVPQIYSNIL